MKTLHINSSDAAASEILSFIQQLSLEGKQVELLDEHVYNYEKQSIDKALEQECAGEVFTSDEVLNYLDNAN